MKIESMYWEETNGSREAKCEGKDGCGGGCLNEKSDVTYGIIIRICQIFLF